MESSHPHRSRPLTTVEERLSRLEGGYEHLATKADLANLKADLLKWMVGMMISSVALAVTVAIFIQRLID